MQIKKFTITLIEFKKNRKKKIQNNLVHSINKILKRKDILKLNYNKLESATNEKKKDKMILNTDPR